MYLGNCRFTWWAVTKKFAHHETSQAQILIIDTAKYETFYVSLENLKFAVLKV